MQQQLLAQCIVLANDANAHGQYESAIAWCQKALLAEPHLPEAWYQLALAYRGRGAISKAVEVLLKTASLADRNPDAQNSIGLQLMEIGALDEAEHCLTRALALAPDYVFAHANLGILYDRQRRYAEAEAAFKKAIELQPELPVLHANLAAALNAQRKHQEAEDAARRSISLQTESPQAWNNLASSLLGQRRFGEAEQAARRGTELAPRSQDAWINLCAALSGLKRFDDADVAAENAIEIDSGSAEAWINRAAVASGRQRYAQAEEAAKRAIELVPVSASAWANLASALIGMNRLDDAEKAARRAIDFDEHCVDAWINLGAVLNRQKEYGAAADSWSKVLTSTPDCEFLLGDVLHARMKACHWDNLDAQIVRLSHEILENRRVSHPFPIVALTEDPRVQRKAAEICARDRFPERTELGPMNRREAGQKIRLGYFSADFHNHATAYLAAELFELHDRNRFEIIAFSFGPDAKDAMRDRVAAAFDRFIDVRDQSDLEIARLSRELEIDIAVDLKGYTEDCRMGIFAFRAAPIQVNYLGYPGTSAAPYIDYLIADEVLIPVESRQFYSEKIVYLPDSYQPNDSKRSIADQAMTREQLGLPPAGFVFCSFNNAYKILPETFAGWMRLLGQVENSVLWLLEDNPAQADNLRREAERSGVDPRRLVFAQRLPLPEHLARHSAADLFLDTYPYNAHTTASDALWAGLPVLTRRGPSFASRVAASLLTAIQLPELITTSQADYEQLAVELAGNPARLAHLRRQLQDNRLTTPLFDAPSYVRHIETAYAEMFHKHANGNAPDHIRVGHCPP